MYLARSELKNSTSHINDHDEAKSGQKAGGTIAPYIMIAVVIGIVLVLHFIVRYWIKPSPLDIRSLFSQRGNQSASPADAEEPPNPALRTRESHALSKLSMKEINGIAPKMDYRYQKQILEMRDSIPVPVIREPGGAMPPPHRERDIDGSPAASTRHPRRNTEEIDNPSTSDDTTTTIRTSTLPAEACQTFSECSICLEFFQDDDFVRETQCHHLYHARCLEWWLAKYRARCPLCQKDLKALRASKPP